jgi:hypothetical protein
MQITVVLRPDAAADLRGAQPSLEVSRALLRDAGRLGVELRPTHPGVGDELLTPFYHVDVDDPAQAGRVLERLRAAEAVESAYVKPPDALP